MSKGLKNGIIIGIIVIVIVLGIGLFIGSGYNDLVSKQEDVKTKYSDISVQLERRADLIPNLVNSVKGYMQHEQDVIDSITKARENLVNANNPEEAANANKGLTTALNNLFIIVENYPGLKSNTNFIQLQDELAGTENRIAVARTNYNEAVKEYNKTVQMFPKNIIAKIMRFEEASYFEAKETSTEVPNVSFE